MKEPHNTAINEQSQLLSLVTGYRISRAIHVVTRIGIPDLLSGGPRTCAELAQAADVNEAALFRLLRSLASAGLFQEVAPQQFALTSMGKLLVSNTESSLRHVVLNMGADWQWQVWGAMQKSIQSGQPAPLDLFGTTIYQYFATHPEDDLTFNAAMGELSRRKQLQILDAYDFSALRLVVDVGGGYGQFLILLMQTYPEMKTILLEQPHVAEAARSAIRHAGFADRCQVVSGDFRTSVPQGGDAYILKGVLGDWSDDKATEVLRACRTAMRSQSRVLVCDHVIQPGNDPQPGKLLDLDMLVITGGRERTQEEFAQLFRVAGLELHTIIPVRAGQCILEGKVQG